MAENLTGFLSQLPGKYGSLNVSQPPWGFYSLLQATLIQRNPFHNRRNKKVYGSVTIKVHVICAHLGFNTIAIGNGRN
jgi:hypothetical protein